MDKLLNKQKLIKMILIFFTISVILDLHFFYNSISTLLRVFIISLLFAVIYFKYSNKKEKKIFLIYFFLLIIYFILHIASNFSFKQTSNLLSELLYFYKMIMNLLIVYIVYKMKIDLKQFTKPFKICLWFICGSIVLCNILGIGYTSYDFSYIQCNIFDWFNKNNCGFDTMSGKGYFHLANQIAAITLLYLPLLLNELKENLKIKNVILLIITCASMLIIGNRIATIVPLIIMLLGLVIYIGLSLIKKEKIKANFFFVLLAIAVIYSIALFNSPVIARKNYYNLLQQKSKVEISKYNQEDSEIKFDDLTTKEKLLIKQLNSNFINNYYPYEVDSKFWDNMSNYDTDILMDSRYVEISIVKRLKELANNNFSNMLGIGYTKVIKVANIEKDYIMQYYTIGIIGIVLLLSLYFILLFKSIFKVFFDMESKLNFKNIMLILSCGVFLVAAYYSGNLLNSISTIIPISFVMGIMLNEVSKHHKKENKILGFKISNLNSNQILKSIFDDANNKKQNIIYNINPLILINFYKNQKMVKEFNSQNYQIPDGVGIVLTSKTKDLSIKNKISGIDFMESICEIAALQNKKIYLYGSRKGVAQKAKEKLELRYKKIKIVGVSDGYGNPNEVVAKIKRAKPDILFVALGSPIQEEFIFNNKKELSNVSIIMPVGGSLDVISGNKKRAPEIFIKIHLEWLYRMIKEPRRIKENFKMFKYAYLVIFKNNCYNKKSEENYDK